MRERLRQWWLMLPHRCTWEMKEKQGSISLSSSKERVRLVIPTQRDLRAITLLVNWFSIVREVVCSSLFQLSDFMWCCSISAWLGNSSGEWGIFLMKHIRWLFLRRVLLEQWSHVKNKDKINPSDQQVCILSYFSPSNPEALSVLLNFLKPARLGISMWNYKVDKSMKELVIIL